MNNARQTALDCLIRWDREKSYPNLLLAQKLEAFKNQTDRAFCARLVYGTIERKITLDYYIAAMSSIPFRKIHIVTRNILRMGLYQIICLEVPASAACNTSVELAKKNGQSKSAGFVNAVLRRLADAYPTIQLPPPEDERFLSVRFSVDKTICDLLCEQYGAVFAEQYFSAIEQMDTATATAAVNLLKTDDESLIALLKQEGVAAEVLTDGLLCLHLKTHPEHLTAYRQGLFHFIGRASYEAVRHLETEAGQTVVDCCSAPGGKLFAAAYRMRDKGEIFAIDIHEHKIALMRRQAQRLGIDNITFICADARQKLPDLIGRADRVLCDVPCSGLGILQKKPDIRYKNMTDFSLTETQREILENGLCYLKDGGKLIYSTCTVNREENERLLEKIPHIHIKDDRLFLPQTDQTDGFYWAEIEKA